MTKRNVCPRCKHEERQHSQMSNPHSTPAAPKPTEYACDRCRTTGGPCYPIDWR